MTLTPNNSINVNGFSLAHYLDGYTMEDVLKVFPDARMEGYEDEEKGYDGIEAGFSTWGGNFYIYSRWGHVRLGCLDGERNPHAEVWLNAIKSALAAHKGN